MELLLRMQMQTLCFGCCARKHHSSTSPRAEKSSLCFSINSPRCRKHERRQEKLHSAATASDFRCHSPFFVSFLFPALFDLVCLVYHRTLIYVRNNKVYAAKSPASRSNNAEGSAETADPKLACRTHFRAARCLWFLHRLSRDPTSQGKLVALLRILRRTSLPAITLKCATRLLFLCVRFRKKNALKHFLDDALSINIEKRTSKAREQWLDGREEVQLAGAWFRKGEVPFSFIYWKAPHISRIL